VAADGRVLDPELRRYRTVVETGRHDLEYLALSGRQPLDDVAVLRPRVGRWRNVRSELPAHDPVDQDRAGPVPPKRRR